jgi:hypothetical protein
MSATSEKPLVLKLHSPAIETATGKLIYPVPDRWIDEFRLKYPTLKALDKNQKGPYFYHCEKCKTELWPREGKKQIHFYHIHGQNGSQCKLDKSKDEDIVDEHDNWINESPTHRTAKQLFCVMLDERRPILIKGARCSTRGCLNCLPDFNIDYQEGDVVHEEYTLDNGTGRSDVALVNRRQIRHIFEIYYKHRTKDRSNYSWFEFKAISVISEFEKNALTIVLRDIKPYDCKNHQFETQPTELVITNPECERLKAERLERERLKQIKAISDYDLFDKIMTQIFQIEESYRLEKQRLEDIEQSEKEHLEQLEDEHLKYKDVEQEVRRKLQDLKRLEDERIERIEKEKREQRKIERARQESIERERRESIRRKEEEKNRLEREKREHEEKERQRIESIRREEEERNRLEKEKREREEKERVERTRRDRHEREQKEFEEMELKLKEKQVELDRIFKQTREEKLNQVLHIRKLYELGETKKAEKLQNEYSEDRRLEGLHRRFEEMKSRRDATIIRSK